MHKGPTTILPFVDPAESVWTLDGDGTIIHLPSALCRLLGVQAAEAQGRFFADLLTPEARERFSCVLEILFQSPEPRSMELDLHFITPGQNTAMVRTRLCPVPGHGGELCRIVCSASPQKAAETLREGKLDGHEYLAAFFESAPFGVLLLDTRYQRAIYANPRFTELTGYVLDEVDTREKWFARAYPDPRYRAHLLDVWQRCAGCGSVVAEVTCKNGTTRHFQFHVAHTDVFITLTLFEVSDRVHAEQELMEVNRKLSGVFEHSPIPLVVQDYGPPKRMFESLRAAGVTDLQEHFESHPEDFQACMAPVVDANDAAFTAFGVRSLEEFNTNVPRFFTPDSVPVFENLLDCLSRGDTRFSAETTFATADGREMHMLAHVKVVPGYEQSLGKVVTSLLDMTARRRAEMESDRSRKLFEDVLAYSDPVLYRFDAPSDRYLYVSRSVEKILGYSPEEFASFGMADAGRDIHPEDSKKVEEAVSKAALASDGSPVSLMHEYRRKDKDGHYRWIHDWHTLFFDDSGGLDTVIGSAYEVTKQKRIEERLRETTRLFDLFDKNLRELLWFRELPSGRILYLSSAFESIFGYPHEKAVDIGHETFLTFIHPDDREWFKEVLSRRVHSSQEYEVRIIRTDGQLRWIWTRSYPVFDEHGNPIQLVGVTEDITERKLAEQELLKSRNQFAEALESSIQVLYRLNLKKNRYDYVSPSVVEASGYSVDEFKALGFSGVMELTHPDDLEVLLAKAEAARAGGMRKHSTTFEYRRRHKNGEYRWYQDMATMLFDENGELEAVMGSVMDITQRKAMEQELRRAKEEAERLSRAKSEFLANMSHEIRNPMNAVLGLADLLLEDNRDVDQGERLELLRQSAQSLMAIIEDILNYSKIEAGRVELSLRPFDLPEMLEALVREQSILAAGKGLSIKLSMDPTLPPFVRGDALRLRQILVNLVGNAVKFTDQGGVEIIAKLQQDHRDGRAGLLFAVADTGIGIPRSKQHMVFKSFSQVDSSLTKRHAGTGLGLPICKSLVELFGGRIWFESTPGAGSIFCFTVTLETADEEAWIGQPPAGEPQLSPLSILLVEDDWINQEFTEQLLSRRGHRVTLADNGRQALAILARGSFDLVLMDMQMPVMDGMQATRAIRSGAKEGIDPDLPVIGLSAYARPEDRQRFLSAGMDGYVTKPVKVEELFRIIADVFRGKKGVSTTSAAGNNLRILDLDFVHDHYGHDPAGARRVCAMYREDLPERVDTTCRLSREKDIPQARLAAHSLVSVSHMVGANAVAAVARELEEALAEGSANKVETLLAQLGGLVPQTLAALDDYLAGA